VYFLVTKVFSVSILILWYLNMSFIDLATICWTRTSVTNAFPRSTDDKSLKWIADQYKTYLGTTRSTSMLLTCRQQVKKVFSSVLHDQTSVLSPFKSMYILVVVKILPGRFRFIFILFKFIIILILKLADYDTMLYIIKHEIEFI